MGMDCRMTIGGLFGVVRVRVGTDADGLVDV